MSASVWPYFDAAIVAFLVISVMLILRVVTWGDIARNDAAWTTISLLATLVDMADGLARTGFIKWFANFVASRMGGLPPTEVIIVLVTVYFFSHYFFSSLTPHTTAMMPHSNARNAIMPISISLNTKHLRRGCWSSGAVRPRHPN
jgi:L-tartrate/succinate antiporter